MRVIVNAVPEPTRSNVSECACRNMRFSPYGLRSRITLSIAIFLVACDRMSGMRRVHAYLMSAAGSEADIEQSGKFREMLRRLERGDSRLPVCVNPNNSLPALLQIGLEWKVDRLGSERPAPDDQGQ